MSYNPEPHLGRTTSRSAGGPASARARERSSRGRSRAAGSPISAPRSSRSSTRQRATRFGLGRDLGRDRVALAPRPVAGQAVRCSRPPRPARPGSRPGAGRPERHPHRELPTRPTGGVEPRPGRPDGGQPGPGRGPDLRLRPDRAAARPARLRHHRRGRRRPAPPHRRAGSATSARRPQPGRLDRVAARAGRRPDRAPRAVRPQAAARSSTWR